MVKFFKSRVDKKICGVCGGIAAALELDPTILRVVFACSLLYSFGTTLIVYFIAALCLSYNDVEIVNNTVRRIYKSRTDKKIFGVCGGIAEYFDVDAFIVRMLFVFSVLVLGFGLVVYIVLAMILPKKNLQLR